MQLVHMVIGLNVVKQVPSQSYPKDIELLTRLNSEQKDSSLIRRSHLNYKKQQGRKTTDNRIKAKNIKCIVISLRTPSSKSINCCLADQVKV